MTLYRQLTILIIIVFLILFLSVFYIGSKNLRNYVNTQLSSHAQDAATSLGIAISSAIKNNDYAAIETYVNAMFDSGYYQSIQVLDKEGSVLIMKQRSVSESGSFPAWIMHLYPLKTPAQKALVMDGWKSGGSVQVISFPEFAYKNLWINIKSIFILFALTVLSLFLISSYVLRILLKPLKAIENQAQAISKRQFGILDIEPNTLEFRRVVQSMNKMSLKLKTFYSEQIRLTEHLQSQAFQDDVTKLPNRIAFMKQLKYLTDTENEQYQGCLLILQLHNLDVINKQNGHLSGDEMLRTVTGKLQDFGDQYLHSFIGRISGTEFAIIIKSVSGEQMLKLGDTLQTMLNAVSIEVNTGQAEPQTNEIAHFGIAVIYPGQTLANLMAEADMSLRLAQQKGRNAYHLYDDHKTNITVYGSSQWHDILKEALMNNYLQLNFQPVIFEHDQLQQMEAMIRLDYKDEIISAGVFIPIAEYLNIAHEIDQWVIEEIIKIIIKQPHIKLSFNLSQDSLINPEFPEWLNQRLDAVSLAQRKRFIIEVSEYFVKKYEPHYKVLVSKLEDTGCQFCIDHFASSLTSFNYLNHIKTDFIKIHGSFANEIANTPEMSDYLRQLVKMAHTMDIQVIAEGIENKEEMDIMKSLNVDLFQGFYIAKPGIDFISG